ncbi:hypothetical protein BDV38DRAFT_92064 [Aspergillus pseudotamarii]|uniref:Uncharacterized protein n=1 Tax=Aspergillus pseudotamarii TaxID=132259 RepID=A0A5N6SV15_ASPPS|nr:uncharacterized protein BDV38DRAFT_92064 [Aspergillus pseudotamarii]KAE8137223.1 hypothetical protein BDV38DRAFT_92064 [Aspergillus pseudotamarii]
MSGNYTYPPASLRVPRGSRAGDRPQYPTANSLQHLRDLLHSERNHSTTRALETLNEEIEEYRSGRVWDQPSFEETGATVDRQIQQHIPRPGMQRLRALNIAATYTDSSTSTADASIPSNGHSTRSRGSSRAGQEERNRGPTSNQLRDESALHIEAATGMSQEADGGRRRVKRRKLESDDNREGLQSFRYGQYGQVVSGALRMELASCDGGTYETDGESTWPENVLRNDSSVYCTKSDRCNLILKHRGETPFCLKKIVIKAPKSGYDAPIQEGMVFVSMTSDELLTRTAQYQIQYTSSQRSRRNRRSDMQPSQEYLNAYRHPLQSLTGRDSYSESDTDISDPIGRNAGTIPDPMLGFRVITDYDERSENSDNDDRGYGNDLPSLADVERLQMDQVEDDFLCSESDDSDSDEDASELSTYNRRRRELLRRVTSMRRRYVMERNGQPRRREVPSIIQPIPQPSPSGPHTGSDAQNPDLELLKPHARFFIERTKSMVSITFDPPPSGRYILIKLWSPHNGGNIDIQSIIAHGYAGPRFFPAGGFR